MVNKQAKIKNIEKGNSYALAFERIKQSINSKFPVEAIALEESIVSDRLRSLLKDAVPALMSGKSCEVSTLVAYSTLYIAPREDKLLVEINDWVKKRNVVIHGIVATRSGNAAKMPANKFVSNAMAVAKKGLELAHQLSHWVDREKRKLKRKT